MSAAPGSQEAGYKPSDAGKPMALGTGNQGTASSVANKTGQTTQTQDRRRSSVDKYSEIRKGNASGAHTHEHADQTHSKPGVLGSLFSSYVKGGK